MEYNESGYFEIKCNSWNELISHRNRFKKKWIFRGQPVDLPLATTLERSCSRFGIKESIRPDVEEQLIRGFRRRYTEDDRQIAIDDTLYCLDLMQHYGAPTRLLDWTYSFFIAAFFAVTSAEKHAVLWCINTIWLEKMTNKIIPRKMEERNKDRSRNDKTFKEIYLNSKEKFVMAENPFLFHQRHIVQKGVFLCPSCVDHSFNNILKSYDGWSQQENITKFILKLNKKNREDACTDLSSMNISNATLFSGIDGFAKSFENELYTYERLANENMGK